MSDAKSGKPKPAMDRRQDDAAIAEKESVSSVMHGKQGKKEEDSGAEQLPEAA